MAPFERTRARRLTLDTITPKIGVAVRLCSSMGFQPSPPFDRIPDTAYMELIL